MRASAPGKVILMGEHAAVYGVPALVAAVDRRVRVEAGPGDSGILVDLASYGVQRRTTWSEVREYARRAAELWRSSSSAGAAAADPRRRDPEYVVTIALGEVARSLDAAELPPLAIRVASDLPIGSGLGSSAAVAVATAAAALAALGAEPGRDRVAALALEVERRQHARPSGVDHTTVLTGGILEVAAGTVLDSIAAARWTGRDLRLFDTGTPRESTGEMVAAVAKLRAADPAAFEKLLDRMRGDVAVFKKQLLTTAPDDGEVGATVSSFERCLELLGVVPRRVQRLIRAVEAAGGAAKISGAGGSSDAGAGCLLVWSPAARRAAVERELAATTPMAASIGAAGLRWEVLS